MWAVITLFVISSTFASEFRVLAKGHSLVAEWEPLREKAYIVRPMTIPCL